MSLDSSHTYLHHHHSHHADLLEDFTHPATSHLQPDEIYLRPEHQPLNPEDEDDVVPDMHAAFGIQRATQQRKEPGWRDFGLVELMAGVSVNGHANGVSRNQGRGQPVVGPGANATGVEGRTQTNGTGAAVTGNGDAAEAMRARRRVEGSVGARLRS
jgi:hypothetical protein